MNSLKHKPARFYKRTTGSFIVGRDYPMRRAALILALVLITSAIIHDICEFVAVNDGIRYFSSEPQRLLYVVLLSLLALVFIVSLVIILFAAKEQKRVLGWFEWLLKLFPAKLRIKLQSFVDLFLQGLNIFEHHWSVLVAALVLTAVGVLLDGFYFFSLFRAFGLQDSFLIVLFGYTLINLSYALPQPPAQLGSNEWMMIIVFSIGFGLTKESASSIMVFAHILTALIMSILGLIAFSFSGYDVIKSIYKDESGYESN